jgi:hypothetical protein
MKAEKVIEKIQESINAIKIYKKSKSIQKKASSKEIFKKIIEEELELYDENDIIEEAEKLIKEAYMLGQSGQPCPRCGGTGRI